jgi:hypothetical protein
MLSYITQPYGRGCFTFENMCMQHGHYIHVEDNAYGDQAWGYTDEDVMEVKDLLIMSLAYKNGSSMREHSKSL